MKFHPRTAASFLLVSLLTVVLACGKTSAGDPCHSDAECESGTCSLRGRCAPGECECSGAECGKTRSSCGEGEVCVAGKPPFDIGYNTCRVACGADDSCPGGTKCTNGLCGTEIVEPLTWAKQRTVACKPYLPCEYEVRPRPGLKIDVYRWEFEDARTPIETTEVRASHVYASGGAFDVKVTAVSATGESFALRARESICAPAPGALCNPMAAGGGECCSGSCVQGVCK